MQEGMPGSPFSAVQPNVNRATGQSRLPSFLQQHVSLPVKLDASGEVQQLAAAPVCHKAVAS